MQSDTSGAAGDGVRVTAVGDLQLGDSSTAVGFGFRSGHSTPTRLREWTDRVRKALGVSDIVLGNLEVAISDAGLSAEDWSSYQMRGRPEYADALRRAGFTVVNVANNHSMQHGPLAFRETLDSLARAGITVVGLKGTGPWCSEPAEVRVRGFSVGFLGYSFRPRQYSSESPLYAEGDVTAVCADVRRLRGSVDSVVVSLHWGEEFVAEPSEQEVHDARLIVDSGADVIVGHHPHVLRGLEACRNGLVAYSLGNFAGDMTWYEPFRTGGILRCSLGKHGVSNGHIDTVRLSEDYHPELAGRKIEATTELVGLDSLAYELAIQRTVRAQRRALYWHALKNMHRFRRGMLLQLVRRTMANRLRGVRTLVGRGHVSP